MKFMKAISLLFTFILIINLTACNKDNNITLSGSVNSDQYDLTTKVDGEILDIKFAEGDNLKKGDLICEIDSRYEQINRRKQELALKMLQSKKASLTGKISKNDEEQLDLEIDQNKKTLEQLNLLLNNYKIITPLNGVLQEILVKKGELAKKGSVLATVNDLKNIWVNLYIPQKHLAKINLKDEISLYNSAVNKIKGKIIYISDKAEFTPKNVETNEAKENTVFKFKVKLKNNTALKPGMIVSTKIKINQK